MNNKGLQMKKIRIYLDNCCFNRPYDEQDDIKIQLETEAKLYIQDKIREGEYDLIWSYILEYENEVNPHIIRKKEIYEWKKIAAIQVEPKENILEIAKEIKAAGLKNKDALHVACALDGKADYLITTDKQMNNKNNEINGIEILNPMGFIDLLEEKNEI